jgi:hypothetical protein
MLPGFVLQGVGLDLVLTVSDPTGLGSVPPEDQRQASGIVDTSEQLGGAVGIAVFTMVLLRVYFGRFIEWCDSKGYRGPAGPPYDLDAVQHIHETGGPPLKRSSTPQ